ncbi:hypothetical protein [Actinacidiphila sp. bgisy145]
MITPFADSPFSICAETSEELVASQQQEGPEVASQGGPEDFAFS